jgi:hypothetical protein
VISASLFVVLTLIGYSGNRSINGRLVDWASGLVTPRAATIPEKGLPPGFVRQRTRPTLQGVKVTPVLMHS